MTSISGLESPSARNEFVPPTLPASIVTLAHGGLFGPGVTPNEHASLIASVALWSLRELGLVIFSSSEHQRWWWPWSRERALMVTVVAVQDVGLSLEQQLLDEAWRMAARSHAGPNSMVRVRDVVHTWLRSDYADPYRELVVRVEKMARRTGWYAAALSRRRNPVTQVLLGPEVIQFPLPVRADGIRRRAESLAVEWDRFRHDENELSSRLIKTVTHAIRGRTDTRD